MKEEQIHHRNECPICGHQKSSASDACPICHHEPEEMEIFSPEENSISTVDVSRPRVSKWRVAATCALLSLLILPWFLMSDLLQSPEDVLVSREQHQFLRQRFHRNQDKWHAQKQQILKSMDSPSESLSASELTSYDAIPLELIMAYLEHDLKLSASFHPDLSWYPTADLRDSTLVLSKYEKSPWPFRVLLSLEIQLIAHGDRVSIEIRRLRRGGREIATGMAWNYFGKELQALLPLERFLGNISQVKFNLHPDEAELSDCDPVHCSWKFRLS